eukprot:349632-Chlamydomonas_euryale.AAC.6
MPVASTDSKCDVPLLFVLSPGTDPTSALLKFAEDQGQQNRSTQLHVISMGQGQGPKAAALIEDARSLGSWILLQNSVKMTNEPPAGLRANLRRSLAAHPMSEAAFWEGSTKPGVFKKLLFSLLYVHAFVQERRTFGAIGWNVPYGALAKLCLQQSPDDWVWGCLSQTLELSVWGFDDGDLRISCRQVHMYVEEARGSVPFKALQYAIGECNYGGRITDDKDRRLMMTLMNKAENGLSPVVVANMSAVDAQVYCPAVLQERFMLSESGIYYVPADGPLESYIKCVWVVLSPAESISIAAEHAC